MGTTLTTTCPPKIILGYVVIVVTWHPKVIVSMPEKTSKTLFGEVIEDIQQSADLRLAQFPSNAQITRRDFLKLLGVNFAGLLLPAQFSINDDPRGAWPELDPASLPEAVQDVLKCTPPAFIDGRGYLYIKHPNQAAVEVPLAPTQWNLDHNQPYHRLLHGSWGIVLHWYGDQDGFKDGIKGYLRGFDSYRRVEDESIQTSAHFLIGDEPPLNKSGQAQKGIGIFQTQAPDRDGTPWIASHLRYLDYQVHKEKKQYFVRAYYQLAKEDPCVHSLLQDMFDGPFQDPNQRTIAIEIAGFDFDNPAFTPGDQKIGNVLATVWALMRRYRIPASNILGHHEIQLGKADPGKKLMATVRFLLGIKALIEDDEQMRDLIFGQFLNGNWNRRQAVEQYFKFVHNYATLVGSRRSIYEWEILSKYWLVMNKLDSGQNIRLAKELQPPLTALASLDGNAFLAPQNHEGVDLYIRKETSVASSSPAYRVSLMSDGQCLFQSDHSHCGHGRMGVFRHYRADGADVLSIYEQLRDSPEFVVGQYYPMGFPLGRIQAEKSYQSPYLHFAIAYGSCWELDLQNQGHPPLNAGQGWITERYLEPIKYLANPSL